MAWILLATLATAAAPAAAPANTSVYTPLVIERCRVLHRDEESESVSWRCPGHAGIPLFVATGDGRFDVDAGVDNGVWESLSPFNQLGPRVEWRLHGGRPIAIIYRYSVTVPEQPHFSRLAVETIGRAGRPGCVIAWIDGGRADANAVARDRADRRAETFRCGVHHAEGSAD